MRANSKMYSRGVSQNVPTRVSTIVKPWILQSVACLSINLGSSVCPEGLAIFNIGGEMTIIASTPAQGTVRWGILPMASFLMLSQCPRL